MSKFSFKKLAAIGLSAAAIATLTAGVAGCSRKSVDLTEPENIEITRLAPPDDGSLPTAHTCAENLAYVVYVFDNQEQYHSYSYGVTSASIATQTTRNFRDYKDGVLLTTDLTYSSMVKSGTQTCTVKNDEGKYEVYFRTSEAPEADTLPSQAVWSEEAPVLFDEYAYHHTYGLLPNELFNYIVNENNIIDSEQITVNSDGTYTQNFTLDPVASTYFYQFGMKTRGGLSGYPEFKSITFSVTFDGGWRILSANMHEVANVNKGIVVSSVSDFATEYWYGDDHFDEEHYSYYDSYYKKYLGDDSLEQGGVKDDKPVMDVTNVLSNGFSQIMNGGAQYEIAAELGNNKYVGYVFLSLDLADPLGTLALKLSLGRTLKEQNLFIGYAEGEMSACYGKDFALTGNLAEVKLAVEQFGDVIDKITAAFGGADGGTSPEVKPEDGGADPVSELMNAMKLTAGEKQAVLTLDTDDLLGLGIGIDARLVFGISNNVITFRGGTVGGLAIGGEKVDLGLTILTTTAPEISLPSAAEGADLADYIADVHSLLGADLIKITANLHGDDEAVKIAGLKNVSADVTAYADIDGVTVGADADVSYTYNGQKISASVSAWYGYDPAKADYGQAVVSLKSFNGAPADINIKCDVKQVAEAISTLVTFAGAQSGASTAGLVNIINGALSADLSGLLTEMYADKASIKIGVSVDELLGMFGIDAGVKFGSCTLKYQRGEGVYGGSLSASLPALGFNMSVSGAEGAIEKPDTESCLDLMYLIDDVVELANAQTLKAEIALDGDAEGVTLGALGGLKADLGVYFNLENIAVKAEADVSYKLGEGADADEVSAKISAWYDKGETKLGKVILSLDEINGVALGAKVYCDVAEISEAVTALLKYAGVSTEPFGQNSFGSVQDVLSKVLGADFATLLPVLETDADSLTVGLNVDGALQLFGVKTGVAFGDLSLVYDHTADKKLTAAMPALGLNVNLSGADCEVIVPDTNDCLDLTKLVNTVNAVWEQVDGIIDGKAIAFEIVRGETFLSLDGILVEVWGEGEVSWAKGGEYVALDLSMAITEDKKASDVATFKFIYDKNADGTPLVRLALNEVGLEIYNEDIDSVKAGFGDIYNKVKALLGGNAQVATLDEGGETAPAPIENPAEGSGEEGAVSGNDKLMSVLFGVLASDKWVDVLNDFTLTADGKSVALSYLSDNAASVEIGADGALTLFYDAAFGERFTMSDGIVASSVTGSLVPAIESKFESCKMSSSKDGTAGFVRLAYDFLFEAISSVSVENILGSETYAVRFALNGDNCNIDGLDGVFINAEIYVTGEKDERGKLAEADLNIDAAGVTINLNVITERRGNCTYFYINLRQVADIVLPDLKIMATQDSLFETFEVLFDTVNNTDILDVVGKLLVKDGSADADKQPSGGDKIEGADKVVISDDAKGKIADILTKLLNFNFSKAVSGVEVDGVLTATIDLDNIVSQLGVKTGNLGTVEAIINHNDHSMTTVGMALVKDAEGNEALKNWISLSSERTARRGYAKFDRSEYISIEFLPKLIEDAVKFATDKDGKLYNSFTLSGSVDVNLVSIIKVKIENSTLTVSFGDDGFYFSFVGYLTGSSLISKGVIGVSYKDGYLTLGRDLNTSNPEYRVMTFDYFIDNMFAKGEKSTLNWLIGANNTIWNMVVSGMGDLVKDINSGLTTPEDVYLYKAKSSTDKTEISMYDYINALRVIVNGNQTAVIGDYSALEKELGVSDNYYGFDLNAGLITDNVLSTLYAAIVRDDDMGISGVRAYGAISSYVTFKATLGYAEGLTSANEFVIGKDLTSGVSAPCLNTLAIEKAAEAGVTIDFNYNVKKPESGYDEIFGCFNTADMSYDHSHRLYSHTLTIKKLNGETETREVRHGSTVYLYDNLSPVYADADKNFRLLYTTDENGDLCGTQFVMNEDITVYAVRRQAVTVIVHSGEKEYSVATFVGDKVPTTVKDLETIGIPTYDEAGINKVGEGDTLDGSSSVVHVYGTFVKSETEVNFVKYTFNPQTLSYVASGKAAGFNDYYSAKGNELVFESYINGYPVTAIGDGAFANLDGKPIKSVVIPATVTSIGSSAFLNNNGLERVIILGEYVKVGGNSSKDNNKNNDQPFYGCSTEADGTSTKLEIYYNTIECGGSTTNTIWTKFRVDGGAIKYRYYIGKKPDGENGYARNGGGALHGKNSEGKATWCMLDVAINGAENVTEVDFNALVEANVKGGFKADGVFTKADADALAATLTSALSQYKNESDNDKYIVNVTLTENTSSDLKLAVTALVNLPKQITVRSAVDMTYGDTAVAGGTDTDVYATDVGEGKVALFVPVAKDGYVFLGWAAETAEGLQFVGQTVTHGEGAVYYAVWGASKVGAEVKASQNFSGNALSAPSSGNGKWYDDNWNEVTEISKDNLIVYTREQFAFSYKVNGNLITKIYDKTPNSTVTGKSSYSASVNVLEGQIVTAVRSADGKSLTIYVDGVYYTEIQLQKYFGVQYTFKTENFTDGVYSVTVNADVSYTFSY